MCRARRRSNWRQHTKSRWKPTASRRNRRPRVQCARRRMIRASRGVATTVATAHRNPIVRAGGERAHAGGRVAEHPQHRYTDTTERSGSRPGDGAGDQRTRDAPAVIGGQVVLEPHACAQNSLVGFEIWAAPHPALSPSKAMGRGSHHVSYECRPAVSAAMPACPWVADHCDWNRDGCCRWLVLVGQRAKWETTVHRVGPRLSAQVRDGWGWSGQMRCAGVVGTAKVCSKAVRRAMSASCMETGRPRSTRLVTP